MSDHGTRARYLRGCKCDPCRDANRRWNKQWRVSVGYGTQQRHQAARPRLVDSTATLDAIDDMRRRGMSYSAISRTTGLVYSQVANLVRCRPARVTAATAETVADSIGLEPVTLDDVAVERFIAGGMTWRELTREERVEAARRMDRRGISRAAIAEATRLRSETLYGEAFGRVAEAS